eukprot:UN08122
MQVCVSFFFFEKEDYPASASIHACSYIIKIKNEQCHKGLK